MHFIGNVLEMLRFLLSVETHLEDISLRPGSINYCSKRNYTSLTPGFWAANKMPPTTTSYSTLSTAVTATEGTTKSEPSKARKSLQSAAALNRADYKGDVTNPPYAIDAEVEGVVTAVDRADSWLSVIELGKKYSDLFGDIQHVFINMTGVMFDDFNQPLSPYKGTLDAFDRLREQDVTVALITNTWKSSKTTMVELLQGENFDVDLSDIFTSSDVCKEYLDKTVIPDYGCIDRPYYLVHQEAYKDFADEFPRRGNETCVIVGLPSTQFDYRLLSKGMDLLTKGAPLIALNMMRGGTNSKSTSLGPGPFISMLSSCTDAEPIAVCKPSPLFYEEMLAKFGVEDYSKAVVIGDDIYEDIAGAKSMGLKAILVRTGRYKIHDEKLICSDMGPDVTADNFVLAVRLIIAALAVAHMSDEDFSEEEKSSRGCTMIDLITKEEKLAKKLEGYTKLDFKVKHMASEENPNPLRLPSYIW